jgi:hypothetical protein
MEVGDERRNETAEEMDRERFMEVRGVPGLG